MDLFDPSAGSYFDEDFVEEEQQQQIGYEDEDDSEGSGFQDLFGGGEDLSHSENEDADIFGYAQEDEEEEVYDSDGNLFGTGAEAVFGAAASASVGGGASPGDASDESGVFPTDLVLGADSFITLGAEQATPSKQSPTATSEAAAPATTLDTLEKDWLSSTVAIAEVDQVRRAEAVTGQFLETSNLMESVLGRARQNAIAGIADGPDSAAQRTAFLSQTRLWCHLVNTEVEGLRRRVSSAKTIKALLDVSSAVLKVGDPIQVLEANGQWVRGTIIEISDSDPKMFSVVTAAAGSAPQANLEAAERKPAKGNKPLVVPIEKLRLPKGANLHQSGSAAAASTSDALDLSPNFARSFPFTVSINLCLAVLQNVGSGPNADPRVLQSALQSVFGLLANARNGSLLSMDKDGVVVLQSLGAFLEGLPTLSHQASIQDITYGLLLMLVARSGQPALLFAFLRKACAQLSTFASASSANAGGSGGSRDLAGPTFDRFVPLALTALKKLLRGIFSPQQGESLQSYWLRCGVSLSAHLSEKEAESMNQVRVDAGAVSASSKALLRAVSAAVGASTTPKARSAGSPLSLAERHTVQLISSMWTDWAAASAHARAAPVSFKAMLTEAAAAAKLLSAVCVARTQCVIESSHANLQQIGGTSEPDTSDPIFFERELGNDIAFVVPQASEENQEERNRITRTRSSSWGTQVSAKIERSVQLDVSVLSNSSDHFYIGIMNLDLSREASWWTSTSCVTEWGCCYWLVHGDGRINGQNTLSSGNFKRPGIPKMHSGANFSIKIEFDSDDTATMEFSSVIQGEEVVVMSQEIVDIMNLRLVACFGASDQVMTFESTNLATVANLTNAVFRLPESPFIERIEASASSMGTQPLEDILKRVTTTTHAPLTASTTPPGPMFADVHLDVFLSCFHALQQIVFSRKYTSETAANLVNFSSDLVDVFPSARGHTGAQDRSGVHAQDVLLRIRAAKAAVVDLRVACLSQLSSLGDRLNFLIKAFKRLNSREASALELDVFQAFVAKFDEVQVEELFDLPATDIVSLWRQLVEFVSCRETSTVPSAAPEAEVRARSCSILLRMTTVWCMKFKDDFAENYQAALAAPMHVGILSFIFDCVHDDLTHRGNNFEADAAFVLRTILPKIIATLCNVFNSFVADCNKFPAVTNLARQIPLVVQDVRNILHSLNTKASAQADKDTSQLCEHAKTLLSRSHELLSVLTALIVRNLMLSVRITVAEWDAHDVLEHRIMQKEDETAYALFPFKKGQAPPNASPEFLFLHGALAFAYDRIDMAQAKPWDSNGHRYLVHDLVSHADRVFQCTAAHTSKKDAPSLAPGAASEESRKRWRLRKPATDLLPGLETSSPWRHAVSFQRAVAVMNALAHSEDENTNAAVSRPPSEEPANAVQFAKFATCLKHVGMVDEFLLFSKKDVLEMETDPTVAAAALESSSKNARVFRDVWVAAQIAATPTMMDAEVHPPWDEEISCMSTLSFSGGLITKTGSRPDYGTAFLDYAIQDNCVQNVTFSIRNVSSSSVYIGIAHVGIDNSTGFAASSMDNRCWYMRNQGELRCGRDDISSTGHRFRSGDVLRIEIDPAGSGGLSLKFYLTKAPLSAEEVIVGEIVVDEAHSANLDDLRICVCIDDDGDAVELVSVHTRVLQGTAKSAGTRESVDSLAMLMNLKAGDDQLTATSGEESDHVAESGEATEEKLDFDLQPPKLMKQSTAQRWDSFVSSSAFKQLKGMLQLAQWRPPRRAESLSTPSTPALSLSTPSTECSPFAKVFRRVRDIIAFVDIFDASNCSAMDIFEARCQKKRRALSRAQGMLLFSTMVGDFSEFVENVISTDSKGTESMDDLTSLTVASALAHTQLVVDSFTFALRAMNDPSFIVKVSEEGTFGVFKLNSKQSPRCIYNIPNRTIGKVVGHLKRGHVFYLTKTPKRVFDEQTGNILEWRQLVSGNWLLTKTGSKSEMKVLQALQTEPEVETDEGGRKGTGVVLQLQPEPDNLGAVNRFTNIVSPLHFLHGSSTHNNIVLESLGGVFLSLRKLLCSVRRIPDSSVPNCNVMVKSCIFAASMDLIDSHQLGVFSSSNIMDEILATGSAKAAPVDSDGAVPVVAAAATAALGQGPPALVSKVRQVAPSTAPVQVFPGPSCTDPLPTALQVDPDGSISVTDFRGEFARLHNSPGWVRLRDTIASTQFLELVESESSSFLVHITNALGLPTATYLEMIGPELAQITHPVRLNPSEFVENPLNTAEICVFASDDLNLCRAVAGNVAQLVPAHVVPDVSAAPLGEASAPAEVVAGAANTLVANGAAQLPTLRDEFCMHLLNSSHRSIHGLSATSQLDTLSSALAKVFIDQFENSADPIVARTTEKVPGPNMGPPVPSNKNGSELQDSVPLGFRTEHLGMVCSATLSSVVGTTPSRHRLDGCGIGFSFFIKPIACSTVVPPMPLLALAPHGSPLSGEGQVFVSISVEAKEKNVHTCVVHVAGDQFGSNAACSTVPIPSVGVDSSDAESGWMQVTVKVVPSHPDAASVTRRVLHTAAVHTRLLQQGENNHTSDDANTGVDNWSENSTPFPLRNEDFRFVFFPCDAVQACFGLSSFPLTSAQAAVAPHVANSVARKCVSAFPASSSDKKHTEAPIVPPAETSGNFLRAASQVSKVLANRIYPVPRRDIERVFITAERMAFGPGALRRSTEHRASAIHVMRNICEQRIACVASEAAQAALEHAFGSAMLALQGMCTPPSSNSDTSGELIALDRTGTFKGVLVGFVRALCMHDRRGFVEKWVVGVLASTADVMAELRAQLQDSFDTDCSVATSISKLIVTLEFLARPDVPLSTGSKCVVVGNDGRDQIGTIFECSTLRQQRVVQVVLGDGRISSVHVNDICWRMQDPLTAGSAPNNTAGVGLVPFIGFKVSAACVGAVKDACLQVLAHRARFGRSAAGFSTRNVGAVTATLARLQCLAMLALQSQLDIADPSSFQPNEAAAAVAEWLSAAEVPSTSCEACFARVVESSHPCTAGTTQTVNLFFPTATKLRIEVDSLTQLDPSAGAVLDVLPSVLSPSSTADGMSGACATRQIRPSSLLQLSSNSTKRFQFEFAGPHLTIKFNAGSQESWGWRARVTPTFGSELVVERRRLLSHEVATRHASDYPFGRFRCINGRGVAFRTACNFDARFSASDGPNNGEIVVAAAPLVRNEGGTDWIPVEFNNQTLYLPMYCPESKASRGLGVFFCVASVPAADLALDPKQNATNGLERIMPTCGDCGKALERSTFSEGEYATGFCCNQCRNDSAGPNTERWWCRQCAFDLCFACVHGDGLLPPLSSPCVEESQLAADFLRHHLGTAEALHVSPTLTSLPLAPYFGTSKWVCASPSPKCLKRSKSTKIASSDRVVRWSDAHMGGTVSLCNTCALICSAAVQVICCPSPVLPLFYTKRDWVCRAAGPFCQKATLFEKYSGTAVWQASDATTKINNSDSFGMCDACVAFFDADRVSSHTTEFRAYLACDAFQSAPESVSWYSFVAETLFGSEYVSKQLIPTPRKMGALTVVPIPVFVSRPSWHFAIQIITPGQGIKVGWADVDGHCQIQNRMLLLPAWAASDSERTATVDYQNALTSGDIVACEIDFVREEFSFRVNSESVLKNVSVRPGLLRALTVPLWPVVHSRDAQFRFIMNNDSLLAPMESTGQAQIPPADAIPPTMSRSATPTESRPATTVISQTARQEARQLIQECVGGDTLHDLVREQIEAASAARPAIPATFDPRALGPKVENVFLEAVRSSASAHKAVVDAVDAVSVNVAHSVLVRLAQSGASTTCVQKAPSMVASLQSDSFDEPLSHLNGRALFDLYINVTPSHRKLLLKYILRFMTERHENAAVQDFVNVAVRLMEKCLQTTLQKVTRKRGQPYHHGTGQQWVLRPGVVNRVGHQRLQASNLALLSDIVTVLSPVVHLVVQSDSLPELLASCSILAPSAARSQVLAPISLFLDTITKQLHSKKTKSIGRWRPWIELARSVVLRAAMISDSGTPPEDLGDHQKALLRCALCATSFAQYDSFQVSDCIGNLKKRVAHYADVRPTTEVRITHMNGIGSMRKQKSPLDRGFLLDAALQVYCVVPTSEAYADGLRDGHHIVAVNGAPIEPGQGNWDRRMASLNSATSVSITLSSSSARLSSVPNTTDIESMIDEVNAVVTAHLRAPVSFTDIPLAVQSQSELQMLQPMSDDANGSDIAASTSSGGTETLVAVDTILSNPKWAHIPSQGVLCPGSYVWEYKLEYVPHDPEAVLRFGVASVTEATISDGSIATPQPILGFQISNCEGRMQLNRLPVLEQADVMTQLEASAELPCLASGDVLSVNLEFSGGQDATMHVLKIAVRVNTIHVVTSAFSPRPGSVAGGVEAVATMTRGFQVAIRSATSLYYPESVPRGIVGHQRIKVRDNAAWLNKSTLAYSELLSTSLRQTQKFSEACAREVQIGSLLAEHLPKLPHSAMFETILRDTLLPAQQCIALESEGSSGSHSLQLQNAELLTLGFPVASFTDGDRSATSFAPCDVFVDIPRKVDAAGKNSVQSVRLARVDPRSGSESSESKLVSMKWDPTLCYNSGEGMSFDGNAVSRTERRGPDYFLALSEASFGKGDKVCMKMRILGRGSNMYLGLGLKEDLDLGNGLQTSRLKNRVWYMRYAGEVRSGDHEYYGGSANYDTGSEVEIKFDATKEPWSIEFASDGTVAGPPVEMTPEDPAAARLHLIICLDEVDDGIEILEIQSNRTTSVGVAGSHSSIHFSCGTPVVRGPGWAPSSDEDGGAGNIGYVVRAVPPLAPSIAGFVDVWWRGAPVGQICRYPHPPCREETSLQADVFPQQWHRSAQHSNIACTVYSRPSALSSRISTCDSATLLVHGIHCEPVGGQSSQVTRSESSVSPASLFSVFHQHVARPKKTGLFESFARAYRFDDPAQVGCSSAGAFSTFTKSDQIVAYHKAESTGQIFMFFAAKARAHCTGQFLYVLDTPMEQWSDTDLVNESAWPVRLGSSVAVFSQGVMPTQQSRHASARPLCFGSVVQLKAGMAKVQLNWNLADGTPACLYTPRGNLAAVPAAQTMSLCFKFGSSVAAAAALAALQRGNDDSSIGLKSCAYTQTMAETAKTSEVWLQVGESQWVCANPRSSSSVPAETTLDVTDAENHPLRMAFEPSGIVPARISPLWCGPAVCGDGAVVRCAPLPKDLFKSRASALLRAAENIATDFASSSNDLAQYPGILRDAWRKANAVAAPSENKLEPNSPAQPDPAQGETEEDKQKIRNALVDSICAELGLPTLVDSPCALGIDALPEELFEERLASRSPDSALRVNVQIQLRRAYHPQVLRYVPKLRSQLRKQLAAKLLWSEEVESLMVQFLDYHARKLGVRLLDDELRWHLQDVDRDESTSNKSQHEPTSSNPLLALVRGGDGHAEGGGPGAKEPPKCFVDAYQPLHSLFVDKPARNAALNELVGLRPEVLIKYLVELNRNAVALALLLGDAPMPESDLKSDSNTADHPPPVSAGNTIATVMSRARHLFFSESMKPMWDQALRQFPKPASKGQPKIVLKATMLDVVPGQDPKAMAATRTFGENLKRSAFGQAFEQLHAVGDGLFFRTGHVWKVTMAGFNSVDAGGPYRESIAMMCDDLQGDILELLVPTPNQRQNVGARRGAYLPNPARQGTQFAPLFQFLGKLMGMAMRSGEFLPLSLAPLFWARLVDSPVTPSLLAQSHHAHVTAMKQFAGIRFSREDPSMVVDSEGANLCPAEDFEDEFCKDFTTVGINGAVHALVPGGASRMVRVEDTARYADLAIEFSIHEVDWAVDCVREGLGKVVPVDMLRYLRWDQVETMVCGDPKVDLDLLKSVCTYEGYSAEDEPVQLFWSVMEQLSDVDRAQVIQFTWSRSRLPLSRSGFTDRFKIKRMSGGDGAFPLAHTCFFQLDLPEYSTAEALREKLLYAIWNTASIDGDGTSTAMETANVGFFS